jgi:hypothetical protein
LIHLGTGNLFSVSVPVRCTVAFDIPTCLASNGYSTVPNPPGGLSASLKILPLSDGLMLWTPAANGSQRFLTDAMDLDEVRRYPWDTVTVGFLETQEMALC